MPRPAKKRNYVEEKARAKGRLDAKDEHDAKLFGWKGKTKLRAKVYNLISNALKKIDYLELAAILGATYFIKNVIHESDALSAKLQKVVKSGKFITWGYAGQLGVVLGAELMGRPIEAAEFETFPDWAEWVLAFVVAFILVRHAGEILGLGQNITVLAGMLLA